MQRFRSGVAASFQFLNGLDSSLSYDRIGVFLQLLQTRQSWQGRFAQIPQRCCGFRANEGRRLFQRGDQTRRDRLDNLRIVGTDLQQRPPYGS